MDENDGDGPITTELCKAYRESIINQTKSLKDDIEKVDSRTWYILGGIIISILLSLLTLVVDVVRRGL